MRQFNKNRISSFKQHKINGIINFRKFKTENNLIFRLLNIHNFIYQKHDLRFKYNYVGDG